MARAVRIRVAGGWYHVMARGHNREAIFSEERDYRHFLELLEEMRERFRVRVYAYCLMPNHYHLLVGTPEGNVSRAIQWVNGSYGIWYNRKHGRSGHLFGERFKAILVEDSAWGLEVSVYIHMNPVATEGLGLGKRAKAAQRQGLSGPPAKEDVARRLKVLRGQKWSSYQAYGGYGAGPKWLDSAVLLRRAGGAPAYRALVEDRIRQGVEEGLGSHIRWGLVLGGERFARKVRGRIEVTREHQGQQDLQRWRGFEQIVRIVERLKGERWERFRDRHGDWGRDVVLWASRRYGGMTLAEIGQKAGAVDYSAVAMAITRLEQKSRSDRQLRSTMRRVTAECVK